MEEFQGQEFLVIIMSTVGWSAVTATRPIGLFSHHSGFLLFAQFACFDSSMEGQRSVASPVWPGNNRDFFFVIGCLVTVNILVLKNVFAYYV